MSRGELIVTVHSANNLTHPSTIGRINPYVKLILSDHQHYKTEAKQEQVTPSFEQSFPFRITGAEQLMKIELKLSGLFSSSVSSSAELPVSQLLQSGMHTVKLMRDGREVGALSISTNFTPDQNQFNPAFNQPYSQAVSQKDQPPMPSFNPSYASPDAPPPYEAESYNNNIQSSPANGSLPPPQYQQPYQPQQFMPQNQSPPPVQYQQPYQQPSPQHFQQNSPQHYQQPSPQSFNQYPGWQPPPQPVAYPAQPMSPPVVVMTLPAFGSRVKLVGHPHHLDYRKHVYHGEYSCNHCRLDRRGPAFHCEIDNFDLCPQCFLQMSQPCAPAIPVLPCGAPIPHCQPVQAYKDVRHPHLLTLENNLYMRSPKPGHFRCDSCQRPGHGQAFHCNTCNYDLHPSCFRQF